MFNISPCLPNIRKSESIVWGIGVVYRGIISISVSRIPLFYDNAKHTIKKYMRHIKKQKNMANN